MADDADFGGTPFSKCASGLMRSLTQSSCTKYALRFQWLNKCKPRMRRTTLLITCIRTVLNVEPVVRRTYPVAIPKRKVSGKTTGYTCIAAKSAACTTRAGTKRMCRFSHETKSPRKKTSSKIGTSRQPRRIATAQADELWPCRRLASVATEVNCANRCTKPPKTGRQMHSQAHRRQSRGWLHRLRKRDP